MNYWYVISDEVLDLAAIALSKGEQWMAYNQASYFIDKEDAYFFDSKQDAKAFVDGNTRYNYKYAFFQFHDVTDVLKEIHYSEKRSKALVTNPDANGLHNHEEDDFTDALINHIEQQQSLFKSQLKTNTMNKENFQYLNDNLKYMGFGENLKPALEKNLGEGKETFQLNYKAEINKKPFEATLNFRKSESSGMYFFNNYTASLEKLKGEKTEQTFYVNKGKGVTVKEAFNLLEGRAVHKELLTKDNQPYKAWIQLDPANRDKHNNAEVKQYHENYGFDLKNAVAKFAIKELQDSEKEITLLQSLQKGNVQSVTVDKDGSSNKMFIEADPQFKKINLYDANMKLVPKESIDKYQSAAQTASVTAVKEEMENDKKKELTQEIKPKKQKPDNKNDKILLPKKRESTKKGLGVS